MKIVVFWLDCLISKSQEITNYKLFVYSTLGNTLLIHTETETLVFNNVSTFWLIDEAGNKVGDIC